MPHKISFPILQINLPLQLQLHRNVSVIIIFSSPEPKAHWCAYRIGRPPSRRPHSLNILSSETAGPIKVKFHMAPPWDGGTKVCSNSPCHITKMATMPIYGENIKKNLFLQNQKANDLELGMQHCVLEYYLICSNDGPGLTLTYFTARSNMVP